MQIEIVTEATEEPYQAFQRFVPQLTNNNLFSVGWFSFPSFYYWLQGWGIYLLGPTIAGLRFTSAVAGALTVVAVYGLSRVLFGRMVGSIAAAFLLVSHFHLQFM